MYLWFSGDAGTTWLQVATINTNQVGYNTFYWTAPSRDPRWISETAKMAISTLTDTPLSPLTYRVDFSDGVFTNAGIVVTSPSTGRRRPTNSSR